MSNLFKIFRNLRPEPALQVGTVASTEGGVSTIDMPGGGKQQARGEQAVGARVFIRNGLIEGVAPALPIELIEI